MKLSVSTYSYGSYIWDSKLGINGCIDHAAKEGFDGIEFVEGDWQKEVDGAKKIKEHCAEVGITPVAFCVGADFINWGGNDGRDEIERIKGLVDTAAELGCTMMRHDVTGGLPNDQKFGRSFDELLPKLAERIREVTMYAEQKGIRTMSENHGFFAQDSDRVEKLINAVGHKNYGALIDCGNFMCADEEPTHGVGVMAPYAFHVHAKDFLRKSGMEVDPGDCWFKSRGGNYLRGTIIGHGEAHVAQSIGIIKRSGYDGFVTVEFEGTEDNLTGIALGRKNLLRFIEQA